MKTLVIHCHSRRLLPYGYTEYIHIGRPSKWGNPFRIGPDGTREQVIVKYEEWLYKQPILADILELKGKVLGCYCKPLACHGDVLAKLADCAYRGPNGEALMQLPVNTKEWRGLYGSSE